MRLRRASLMLTSVLVGAVACGSAEDPSGGDEPVAQVEQHVWETITGAKDAVEMIQLLYEGVNWFECQTTVCESEAHGAARLVIDELEEQIAVYDTDDKISDVHTLLDRAALDYAHPELVSQGEEQDLVNDLRDVFFHFRDRLNNTDPTNQAQVNSAYVLAPFFNVLAALVDNVAHTALKNGRIPMDHAWINARRADTLATNYRLVGSQSLWYECPGATTQVSTVESIDNAFQTKKLWMKFANYEVDRGFCDDDYKCNAFKRATSEPLCWRVSCPGVIFCHACVPDHDGVYRQELPKILERMNRDENVITVRTAIETLVAQAAERGAGLLWHSSAGQLDLWQTWSSRSRRELPLGSADPNAWRPVGSGDYDGDSDGDVLWVNLNDHSVSYWELENGEVTLMTQPTNDFRYPFSKPYFGDLDGDGVSDIVWSGVIAVGTPGGTVYDYRTDIWLMTRGSTVPHTISNLESGVEHVQGLGNFAGDGRADILRRAPAVGTLTVDVSGGGRITLGAPSSDWVVKGIGDFNADSWSDVLLYNTNSGAVVVWAIENGSVIADVTTGSAAPSTGWSIEGVADVDRDGISDIVWRNTSGVVSYWMLNGPSSVREYTTSIALSGSYQFAGVAELGPRLPANASMPAISESHCGASTGRLRNAGFTEYEQWWGGSFYGSHGTFLRDVDGDNRSDLVGFGDGYVGVIRSTGTSFGDYETWHTASVHGTRGTLLGDVNGDSKSDIVSLHDDSVNVRLSSGTAFSGAVLGWNGGFYGSFATLLGDVDGDRRADLVGLGDGYIGVIRANAGGGFGGYEHWWTGTFHGGFGTFLADVDADGDADLATVGVGSVDVLRSTGGGFGARETWLTGSIESGGNAVLLGDVNGDSRADLVVRGNGFVQVRRSTGDSFGEREVWWSNTFNGNRGNFVGDVNGDGRGDLIGSGDGYIGGLRSQ